MNDDIRIDLGPWERDIKRRERRVWRVLWTGISCAVLAAMLAFAVLVR